MKVNFKDLKKNLYSLDCQPEETIADIKAKLIDLLKLDPSKFELRLIYSGSILKDINTAEKSGLVDDCTVSYMVKKLVIKKPIGTPAVSAAKAPVATEAESATLLRQLQSLSQLLLNLWLNQQPLLQRMLSWHNQSKSSWSWDTMSNRPQPH